MNPWYKKKIYYIDAFQKKFWIVKISINSLKRVDIFWKLHYLENSSVKFLRVGTPSIFDQKTNFVEIWCYVISPFFGVFFFQLLRKGWMIFHLLTLSTKLQLEITFDVDDVQNKVSTPKRDDKQNKTSRHIVNLIHCSLLSEFQIVCSVGILFMFICK